MRHGTVEGFPTVTLANAELELVIVPQLGARFLSLRSPAGGREWMWRPAPHHALRACEPGTAFELGSLAGADECIPTVLPCQAGGVAIPDHGEAWSRSWDVDIGVGPDPAVVTSLTLRTLPLHFSRRVTLRGHTVLLEYTLTNLGPTSVPYIWAFHPMLAWREGDEIELGGTSDILVTGSQDSPLQPGDRGPWPAPRPGVRLDRGEIGSPTSSNCKAFLATERAPTFALVNRARGERLTLAVDPAQVPAWGYWLSRGGWMGHTHMAIEPSSAPCNSIAELAKDDTRSTLPRGATRQWAVTLRLG